MAELLGKMDNDVWRSCLRPTQNMNVDWMSHAGKKNREYAEGKKIWGKEWESSVGSIVFGQGPRANADKERQFNTLNHSAGGLSALISREPDREIRTAKTKRIYHGCPMNVSQMDRVMHNQTGEPVTPRHKFGPEEKYLHEQFRDAAGVSPRFHRENKTPRGAVDNAVCIYR